MGPLPSPLGQAFLGFAGLEKGVLWCLHHPVLDFLLRVVVKGARCLPRMLSHEPN